MGGVAVIGPAERLLHEVDSFREMSVASRGENRLSGTSAQAEARRGWRPRGRAATTAAGVLAVDRAQLHATARPGLGDRFGGPVQRLVVGSRDHHQAEVAELDVAVEELLFPAGDVLAPAPGLAGDDPALLVSVREVALVIGHVRTRPGAWTTPGRGARRSR